MQDSALGTGQYDAATVPDGAEPLDTIDTTDTAAGLSGRERLLRLAATQGDISAIFSDARLTEIGMTCVENYERDLQDRKEWEDVAREALDACSQEEQTKAKDYPWKNASNMRWPLLTIAAMQFNARMYPAVVKGDEAVLCKVIGNDNGQPAMGKNPRTGEIQPIPAVDPQTNALLPQPQWLVPPGAKTKRARRVAEYMNTTIFYRMENWEDDTDALLMQLPAVGCVFRKVWTDENRKCCTATVSALNIVVPINARNLQTTPRATERIENVYPHEINARQRSGYYREVDIGMASGSDGKSNTDGARLLLEQHCLWDFDEDGLEEPYIVTLDHQSRLVLRIEPNFGLEDVTWGNEDRAVSIKAGQFYVKYGLFPHPKGKFYDIGFGHLLKRLGDVIDTSINQLLDAGHAQTAGGGFIGAGVRLQARGSGGKINFAPGEYKTVDVAGDELRAAIVERTLPNVSPVTFQVLEMVMGAARDIAGIKDVMTGEASNQGQVGTTLALIEQGLQVFNAVAKRVFRALKKEFELIFDCIAAYGGDSAAQDYRNVLDDPEADFAKDFSRDDIDIRPISDPSSITRMQKMAKAQFQLGLVPQIQAVGGDAREVIRRVLEAVDTEDIDKILPPPPQPDPQQQQLTLEQITQQIRGLAAKASKDEAGATAAQAKAMKDAAEAAFARFNLTTAAGAHGMELGATAAALNGA